MTEIGIARLTQHFGAILTGVDMRYPDSMSVVRQAVHDHGVVFLRDQRLSDKEHTECVARYGELGVYPVLAAAGSDEPLEFIEDGPDDPPKADGWHTDVTWIEKPPVMAFLCMLEVPDEGGDTLWVDTARAYDTLSPVMQGIVQNLSVYHDMSQGNRDVFARKFGAEVLDRTKELYGIGVEHPLVRTHPHTGRKSLFVAGYFMHHIVGMTEAESQSLLSFLMSHATQPEFSVRWQWQLNDMAIWDERRTMHRALGDHFPRHRKVRRCTILGERPA